MHARRGGALLALAAALVLGDPGPGRAQAAEIGGIALPGADVTGPCGALVGDDDCLQGAVRLVNSFYDEVCYVTPSATTTGAAAAPEVCGKDTGEIAGDATALSINPRTGAPAVAWRDRVTSHVMYTHRVP